MRWKLLVIVSLVATIAGLGVSLGLTLLALRTGVRFNLAHPAVVAAELIMPVAALAGGIFVYRHTARRRKLQAGLTAVLTLILQTAVLLSQPLLMRWLGR